jgi:hypothetical protein
MGWSGCLAPHILTYALDGTWYLPSRYRRFNYPPRKYTPLIIPVRQEAPQ